MIRVGCYVFILTFIAAFNSARFLRLPVLAEAAPLFSHKLQVRGNPLHHRLTRISMPMPMIRPALADVPPQGPRAPPDSPFLTQALPASKRSHLPGIIPIP